MTEFVKKMTKSARANTTFAMIILYYRISQFSKKIKILNKISGFRYIDFIKYTWFAAGYFENQALLFLHSVQFYFASNNADKCSVENYKTYIYISLLGYRQN